MPDYQYEAATAEGRIMRGQLTATSPRDAQRMLRAQGLAPLVVNIAQAVKKTSKAARKRGTRQDQILVLGELAVLLDAGVSLAEAVKSLGDSELPRDLSDGLESIERSLRQGQPFSLAIKQHLPMLPPYAYQLVGAGEMTGELASALRDSSTQMDYDFRVLQEIRNALVYPSVLVTAGVSAVLFIFIVVVPRFASMFKTARVQVPLMSEIVMSIGLYTRAHLPEIAGVVALTVFGAMAAWRRPAIRNAIMEFVPRLPLFGAWMVETETGRWAAMLSVLLRNRIPLIQSLEMSRGGLRIPTVRDQMAQVEKAVRGGKSLADALSAHTSLMAIGVNLVRIGERAGNLPDMLRSLAELNERSAKDRMKRFLLIIEPAAIIIIGGVIGVIVTSIMLAVTAISNISL